MVKRLLRPKEIQKRLAVGATKYDELVKAGVIKLKRLGPRCVAALEEHIDALIDSLPPAAEPLPPKLRAAAKPISTKGAAQLAAFADKRDAKQATAERAAPLRRTAARPRRPSSKQIEATK